jgi:two-component system sensor histidine kinase/response regulator
LRNLAGNAALYRQLLQRFMQSQEHSVDQVQQAIQEHRLQDAMQKLHSLRGAAANLGALSLAGLATQLKWSAKPCKTAAFPSPRKVYGLWTMRCVIYIPA